MANPRRLMVPLVLMLLLVEIVMVQTVFAEKGTAMLERTKRQLTGDASVPHGEISTGGTLGNNSLHNGTMRENRPRGRHAGGEEAQNTNTDGMTNVGAVGTNTTGNATDEGGGKSHTEQTPENTEDSCILFEAKNT